MTPLARGAGWPVFAGLAAVLLVAGIALVTAAGAGSRPGPPMPPADAAGTIVATSPTSDSVPFSRRVAATRGEASATAAAPTTTLAPASHPASTAATGSEPAPSDRSAAPELRTDSPATPGSVHITGPVLAPSTPVSLSIPALNVTSPLVLLGLNPDGTVQVPDLNDPDSKAGWFDGSPTPGAPGPSIILGHIDSRKYGPGVFYRLGDLRPGDTIEVTRADTTVAVFRVDGVRSYPKNSFPTLEG